MKTSAGKTEDGVQLRRGTQRGSGGVGGGAKKQQQRCRVLFSYQPKHEDELELKMDEVVDFLSEVEDGWWKGKLKGKVGVFPSNFVEMITASIEDTSSTSSSSVIDKNKKNEKMKEKTRVNVVIAEKNNRVSSKISSLIQEAESKATKKKSTENLNLVRRESPLGSETEHKANKNSNTDELLANAPKLPPKPGPRSQNQPETYKKKLPSIQISQDHVFDLPPLVTLSPFDTLSKGDCVFFSSDKTISSANSSSKKKKKNLLASVFSINDKKPERRTSLGSLFVRRKHSSGSTLPDFPEEEETTDGTLKSTHSLLERSSSFWGAAARRRSKSERHTSSNTIDKGAQAEFDFGLARFIRRKRNASTQTCYCTDATDDFVISRPRNRIITNPRLLVKSLQVEDNNNSSVQMWG